jgi:hypothetical protein
MFPVLDIVRLGLLLIHFVRFIIFLVQNSVGLALFLSVQQRWADRYFGPLVRWSAAQRTTEMLADQQTGKNRRPAPADCRN